MPTAGETMTLHREGEAAPRRTTEVRPASVPAVSSGRRVSSQPHALARTLGNRGFTAVVQRHMVSEYVSRPGVSVSRWAEGCGPGCGCGPCGGDQPDPESAHDDDTDG